MEKEKQNDEHLNVRQTAERLGVSASTVIKLIRNGRIPNAFIFSRRSGYSIPLSDIVLIEQQIKKDEKQNEDYLSVSEMALMLNCSDSNIRYAIRNGKIKKYRLHNKMYLVHISDFDEYIHEYLKKNPDCLNLQETANRLNVSKATIGNYVKDNVFPNVFIRNQTEGFLIPLSDIESFEYTIKIPDGFIAVKEIAKILDCHPESVRELIRNGKFKNVKSHLGKSYIVSTDEVEKYYEYKIDQIKDYLNITNAAEFLSCDKDTIRSYLKKGVLKNYLYREKREGYLIHKDDLLRLKETLIMPNGFMKPEEAAKKLGIGVGQVLNLARNKFVNSYKIKKNNGAETWIVSEEDVFMYKKVKEQRFTPENPGEYTTLDAVNKFKFETKDLIVQVPESMGKTYELFSSYAKSKLSNSNARAETLKKKVAYYIKTLEIILQILDKNIYDLTDDEVEDILNDPNIVEYVKQYFIGFTQFCSENVEGCKFKNDYKTSRENTTETEIYSLHTFKDYFEHVKDIDSHLVHAIKLKTYAQTWLYLIMHLMNAWRSGDIIYGLPKIDFDELDIKDFTYFTNHKLTREQSQLIINQVHIKVGKIKFSKTGALGQFLCIDSLAIPFATAISIVELHRRKRDDRLLLSSINSNGVNKKFFQKNRSLENFDSLKMNRTLITYFFHYVSKSEGDAHLSYDASQILRSHINEDTTMVYIKFSNSEGSLDEISFNICERGHFGWVFNCMINLFFDQEHQTIQERTKMIQAFQENYTVPAIETYASFLLAERNQKESLALRIAKMSKEELKDVITMIFRGEMPAKTELAQCLSHPNCPYPTRKTCIGCEYLVPTEYLLISATEQIKTTMLNLYNSKTARIRERELHFLKNLFLLINQAIVEKGNEYVDTFIDRKQLKELFLALTEYKGREIVIDTPKKN